jgi:hypothetical protein
MFRKYPPMIQRRHKDRVPFQGPCSIPDRAAMRPDTGDDYIERAHRLRDHDGDLEGFVIETF